MSVRSTFWLLFILFFFVLPFPMWGPWDPLAPTVRYALLSGATGLVIYQEGAAGPVPFILALFALHTAVYAGVCALLAWLVSRAVSGMAPPARRNVIWVLALGALAVALLFDLYSTPFGRTPVANLLGVLS